MAMYCSNCNMPRPNDPCFCSECGTPLIAPPARKKGKIWPPILFMVVMLTVGSVLFALTKTDTPTSKTPWFTIEDGVLYFNPEKYTGGPTVKIPATVNGETVTTLSAGCFQNCDDLVFVELPDTLTAIGGNAFSNCDKLRGVKLPENVRRIGSRAFANCGSLEAIYVPKAVTAIGTDAFLGCDSLQHIFFVGNHLQWSTLYPDRINSMTEIYTVSGPDAETFSPG